MQTRARIEDCVRASESLDVMRGVAKRMEGSTMHHHTHILYDLRTLLGPGPKVYTEIGTFNGGSACLMLQHPYPTEIHCIDPLDLHINQKMVVENNFAMFNTHGRKVHIHSKYSSDREFMRQLRQGGFVTDILFVDGDHSYQAVTCDFSYYSGFVNEGGFIVFDDYEDYKYSPDVRKAVDDIVSGLDLAEFAVIGNIDNVRSAYDCLGLYKSNLFVIQKRRASRVKWVPSKVVDMEVIVDKLRECERVCQFANNGRYVRELQDRMRVVLGVDERERDVVAVCNGAGALQAAVGAMCMWYGRSLKWATQAFTFPCAHQGLLRDSLVLDMDCKHMGPSLEELTRVCDDIDGVIVTNCFGCVVNIQAYAEFCDRYNKLLIFDNAATPLTQYKGKGVCNYGHACIVSLHHTKPIGFGEGGVVVCEKRFRDVLDRAICFGHSEIDKCRYSEYAGNYKMSEIAAVFQSGFLERVVDISRHHREMIDYFVGEMDRMGVRGARLFPNFSERGETVAGAIPVLFERAAEVEPFLKEGIDAKKYYYPISADPPRLTPRALDLFERIVCLPLHLEVSRREITRYVRIVAGIVNTWA